jgi:DNA polymerase III gamma/tau subunit
VDLLRAFEVLTKAELDIRSCAQPRYHLEMALLRWIHLRKLVPLSDLIRGVDKSGAQAPARPAPRPPASNAATVKAVEALKESARAGATTDAPAVPPAALAISDLKDAFLAELRKSKKYFYGTVVAQAQRIDVETDRIVFIYAPQHRALRVQFDQTRAALEALATELAGRKMAVVALEGAGTSAPPRPGDSAKPAAPIAAPDRQATLRQQALADSGVQAMLDVFAAEIKDVEER